MLRAGWLAVLLAVSMAGSSFALSEQMHEAQGMGADIGMAAAQSMARPPVNPQQQAAKFWQTVDACLLERPVNQPGMPPGGGETPRFPAPADDLVIN